MRVSGIPLHRQDRRALASVLVDVCVGREPLRPAGADDPDEVVRAARFHRIAPLVHAAFRDRDPELSAQLAPDRMRSALVHLQSCGALHQLGSLLPDIAWLTFKGPVLSELAHPLPGLRSYNDVDVLVAASDLREISDRLLSAGWRVADYQDMLRNVTVPGEMHWISPGGALIDLHWSMINMASRRRRFHLDTADLLRRRTPISLGGNPAWTLDPVDALVHACLHAALSGANKLIYLIDVDRLGARIANWDAVADRALEWQAQAQVGLVLSRAQRVLGSTTAPADLLERLGIPKPLRSMMAFADRVAPIAHASDSAGLPRFLARALQPTIPATARMVGRNVVLGIKERLSSTPPPREQREDADRASLEIYLAAAEAAGARRKG